MDESEVKYYTCSIKFTKTVKLFKISIHKQIHPSNEFVKICSWSQKCHHLKNISIESNKALCTNNHNAFYDVAADEGLDPPLDERHSQQPEPPPHIFCPNCAQSLQSRSFHLDVL